MIPRFLISRLERQKKFSKTRLTKLLKIKETIKENYSKISLKKGINRFFLLVFGKAKRVVRIINSIFIGPTRQLTHLSVFSIIVLVMAITLISSGTIQAQKVDPFGISEKIKGSCLDNNCGISEISESQTIADIAGVIDKELVKDANTIKTQKVKRATLSLTGNNFLADSRVVSTTVPEGRPRDYVINYTVEDGDTLWSIARKFNITTDTVRWANSITRENEDLVKPGRTLVILPVPGVLHTVAPGDSVEGIAGSYQASVAMIRTYNDLEDKEVKPGMKLIVPDGQIYDPPKPEPEPEPAPSRTRLASSSSSSYGSSYQRYSGGSGGRFPYGYCTWWVAQKRYVPWLGNAWQWYYNAQSYGYATGRTPAPGSIMVTWESGVGHVGYVESVSGSTFTISEMNYYGYGVVNNRTLTPGSVPLIGFIY